jgi:hypothetical protein
MKKKTNEEKEKKFESTGLTRQTWDSCHESLIIKKKKRQKKTKGISFFIVDCTVQSIVKGLKRKRKENKGIRHGLFFSLHKKHQKMLRFKSVRSFNKDIPKSLWSSCNA